MFGTYTVKLTKDNRGVQFSPQPTPLAIIVFLLYVLFPPYVLLAFMIGHTVVNNEKVTDMMAPWASQSIHYMKLGTEMAVDKVQDMIHDLKSGDEHVVTEEVVQAQPDETKVDVQNVQDAQEIQLQRLDGVTESEEDEGIEKTGDDSSEGPEEEDAEW